MSRASVLAASSRETPSKKSGESETAPSSSLSRELDVCPEFEAVVVVVAAVSAEDVLFDDEAGEDDEECSESRFASDDELAPNMSRRLLLFLARVELGC